MDALLHNIINQFQLEGKVVSCEVFGCGQVNKTYLVTTETGHRYTLQRIGPAFKDVHALQDNIRAVTEHLHSKTPEKHGALTLIPTTEVRIQENQVKLHKRGRMLVASYEAVKYQRLDLFSVMLRQIGAQIMRMHLRRLRWLSH